MIRLKLGNLFDDPCKAYVNTVNCVGVMGKGVALECKKRFPEVFYAYKEHCRTKKMRPGEIFETKSRECVILNAATKDHWARPSEYDWVSRIVFDLRYAMHRAGIERVALPLLGCGNGGLNPETVMQMLLEEYEDDRLELNLYVGM